MEAGFILDQRIRIVQDKNRVADNATTLRQQSKSTVGVMAALSESVTPPEPRCRGTACCKEKYYPLFGYYPWECPICRKVL